MGREYASEMHPTITIQLVRENGLLHGDDKELFVVSGEERFMSKNELWVIAVIDLLGRRRVRLPSKSISPQPDSQIRQLTRVHLSSDWSLND
jgi:hypothetical protein